MLAAALFIINDLWKFRKNLKNIFVLAHNPSFCQTLVTGSTGLNVLSLFEGMSCGQIALQKAGIKVNKYFASEIKPHAIKVTQHNFPNTIQLGSVLDVKATDLPKIDLLIGGSPCKGISRLNKTNKDLNTLKVNYFGSM